MQSYKLLTCKKEESVFKTQNKHITLYFKWTIIQQKQFFQDHENSFESFEEN